MQIHPLELPTQTFVYFLTANVSSADRFSSADRASNEVRLQTHRIVGAVESKSRANPQWVKRKDGQVAKAKTGFCANPERMTSQSAEATSGIALGSVRMQWMQWACRRCGAAIPLVCLAAALISLVVACAGEPENPTPSDSPVLETGPVERETPDSPDPATSTANLPPPGLRAELGFSPDVHFDTHLTLQIDLEAVRHPSDGGGKAWMASARRADGRDRPLQIEDFGRFEIIYQAGPLGIEVGGQLHFQVSSFWDWDPPQTVDPAARGYTEVRTDAAGVKLELDWYGSQLLTIVIGGRKLEAGEQIEITYGAGPIGAKVDSFAERGAEFWLAVDGDGDGIRKFVDNPPRVDILPADAAELLVFMPTSLHPGESFDAVISFVDQVGNAGVSFEGRVELQVPAGIELPKTVVFAASDAGRKTVSGVARSSGVYRIEAQALATGAPESQILYRIANPILVEAGIPHVRWADLHGHTQLSDGTGTPDDYFRYAREIAGLDIVALTDHDHWGYQFLDAHPHMWQLIRDAVKRHHQPGRFITLLGYEWTSWLHGHRHVLYFEDRGEVLSSLDPRYETPAQLWDALRGQPALTFAHHSAGGPVATNWSYRPDPILEPITEIVSIHGSSEAADSPQGIYNPVPGNFVRDVLGLGYRLGFIGSGDSHDGHPGNAHIAAGGGAGLAAILSDELSRKSVLEALRARRTYATNGPRIWLEVSIDGQPMGSTLAANPAGETTPQTLRIRVIADGPISQIELIRSGSISTLDAGEKLDWSLEREIPRLAPGEFHYVRVSMQSGGLAWSSPIFAD